MKVGDKTIHFRVLPRFGRVYAEIYYTEDGSDIEFHLTIKWFGSRFFKPKEKHYKKANEWCLGQLRYIEKANKL